MSMLAAKHLDPVMGIDVHMVITVPPAPAPVPLPHPHVGFVLDLREYVGAASAVIGAMAMSFIEEKATEFMADNPDLMENIEAVAGKATEVMNAVTSNAVVAGGMEIIGKVNAVSASVNDFMGSNIGRGGGGRPVFVNGLMRTVVGTHTNHVPGLHFPLGATFAGIDAPVPSQDSESYMGSRTVLANNDPMSFAALPALSCWFTGMLPMDHNGAHTKRTQLSLPTSVMLPIPVGRPVLVGGPPVLNMMALGTALFKAFRGSKLAKKLFAKMPPGFLKCVIFDAEPVNSVTGEVIVQQHDFTVAARLPVVWNRYYASHDEYAGCIGNAWQSPADIRIELARVDGDVVVYAMFPDHLTGFDEMPSAGGWAHRTYDLQHGHALYWRDKHLVLRTRESVEYAFDMPSGWASRAESLPPDARIRIPVTAFADLNGNAWHFARRPDGIPVRMAEWAGNAATGRSIEFGPGSLPGAIGSVSLTDADGHVQPLVVYRQDKDRNLSAVLDALNEPYTFEYAGGRHMVRHTDRNGLSFFCSHKQHDDNIWRVDHAWGDHGLFDYRFVYDAPRLETRLTDSLGHTTILQYNDQDLPVARINPLGGVSTYRYDSQGRTCAEVDPSGFTTTWEYDALGNLLAQTLPDMSVVRTRYNEDLKPVEITDPEGGSWQQGWDERGNLVRQIAPSGAATVFDYDALGQLVTVIDPAEQATSLSYDAIGFVIEVRDPLGQRTQFHHDSLGNVVQRVSANGDTSAYEYDAKSRLVRCQLPGSRPISCAYDAEDNLTQYIDEAGRETRFEYFGQGNIKTRIDPDGTKVSYEYDTEEQLTGVVNQRGQRWQLKRDAAGQLIEEVDYWGQSRRYSYNPSGHLTHAVDPLNQALAIGCDPLGRIVSKHADEIENEHYAYNRRGQLIEARNRYSAVTRTYTLDGELETEAQQQAQTEALLEYVYDAPGRLIEQRRAWRHGMDAPISSRQTLRYGYDALGQLATQQIDDHPPIRFEHDALGRLIGQQLTAGLTQHYRYSAAGQLARHTTRRSGFADDHTDYFYDAAGNLTRRSDSRGGTDEYRYDLLGQIVGHTDPAGRIRAFVYDRVGDRFTAQRDDAGGRTQEFADGTVYRLDKAGQLVERFDGRGRSQSLEWNALGRLRKLTTRDGERYEYVYDALGRRICKLRLGAAATRTWFVWDGDAMVGEVRQGIDENRAAQATWLESKGEWSDALGRGRGGGEGGGFECRWYAYRLDSFEPMAMRVGGVMAAGADKLYYYQNDPNGMPLRLRGAAGDVVWDARYSVFGAVEGLRVEAVEQPLRLQGQYFDGESGLSYNRHRYYDGDTGRFISQDPIGLAGGINPYQLAPNVLKWVDPLGLMSCSIEYGELDNLDRPTGVRARLYASFINTGTNANPNIQTPGFITGAMGSNRARGHLLGRQLGGRGDDPRNLVTIQQRPANTPTMSGIEGNIRMALERGEVVDVSITPIYKGDLRIPAGITIRAEGSGGFFDHVTVLNPPGM